VTFSKVHFERQYPASLHYRRPVIVVNQGGGAEPDIVSVNWSPQFEAPLHIDPSQAEQFYRGYRCVMYMRKQSIWSAFALFHLIAHRVSG
jgi:hypothetical protein